MLEGLLASKKFGLASFCRPAKLKVTPRKARSGRRAQPARAVAFGGATSPPHRGRRGAVGRAPGSRDGRASRPAPAGPPSPEDRVTAEGEVGRRTAPDRRPD